MNEILNELHLQNRGVANLEAVTAECNLEHCHSQISDAEHEGVPLHDAVLAR